MSMSDNIADMLTRIRNGQKSKLLKISVYRSNYKCRILDILQNEGYILGYSDSKDNIYVIDVWLKYSKEGIAAISEIIKVSKPSKRVYSGFNKLKSYYNNMGIQILSTSKGIKSDKEIRSLGIGGEIICKIF